MVIAVPTNDGLTQVVVLRRRAAFDSMRHAVDAAFHETVREATPHLFERIHAGARVERYYGTGDLPFFFRKPYGAGWALVGDAGCHKDPILAQGMTDAFRSADLLADALDDAFAGRRPFNAAMASYEHQRNLATKPLYELARRHAAVQPPPPEAQAMFASLRGDRDAMSRFFSAIEGTIPLEEFFGAPLAEAG